MKHLRIIIATLTALSLCSCQVEENNEKLIQSTTTLSSVENDASEKNENRTNDIVETEAKNPIEFGEANEHINDGYSEEFLRKTQYQIGNFNFIPFVFNDRALTEETFEEFTSLLRNSDDFSSEYEEEQENGSIETEINLSSGASFEFSNKKLTKAIINDWGSFDSKCEVMGVSLGDDIERINYLIGTSFVSYPELRTLVIRDEKTLSFIQFSLNDDGKISEMTIVISE